MPGTRIPELIKDRIDTVLTKAYPSVNDHTRFWKYVEQPHITIRGPNAWFNVGDDQVPEWVPEDELELPASVHDFAKNEYGYQDENGWHIYETVDEIVDFVMECVPE